MSKTLFLIRHAKSSWADLSLSDHDRPLGERGKRDLPIMARHIAEKYGIPDLILSSTAKRAKKTALGFAKAHRQGDSGISFHPNLYLTSPDQALAVLKTFAHGLSVGITGHNPGWTDFVNRIEGVYIDNMPTCGVAVIDCLIEDWVSLEWKDMRLVDFVYPKKLTGC